MLKLRNLLACFFILGTFICSACNKEQAPVQDETKTAWGKKDIDGIMVYKRTNSFLKSEKSGSEILESLNREIQNNHLIKDTDLTLSITLGRLTIAGETHSARELQAVILIAMQKPEVNEIVSTAIITGEGENIL